MTFDQEQSSRLGQRLPVENPGIRIVTFSTLPEVAYTGQIVYLSDLDYILIYDGTAWQAVGDGSVGAGSHIYVSATDPSLATTVADGDEWYNTSTQTLKLRDSGSWVDPQLVSGQADGITITGSVFQTAASGQRIVMLDDGSGGVIESYTGLTGETNGFIDPSAASGTTPAITIQSPAVASGFPVAAKFALLAGAGGGFGDSPRTQFYVYSYLETQQDAKVGAVLDVVEDVNVGGQLTITQQPYLSRWRTSNQSLTTGGNTSISYGTGTGGDVIFQGTDATPDVTIPEAGVYAIVASLGWDTSVTAGRRQISIFLNTVQTYVMADAGSTMGTNSVTRINAVMKLAGSDTITIKGFQNSGSSVNVLGDPTLTYLQIYKMG